MRGRVIDYRCPIEFDNGCRVEPGDLIVGDIDGVIVIPRAQEAAIIGSRAEKSKRRRRRARHDRSGSVDCEYLCQDRHHVAANTSQIGFTIRNGKFILRRVRFRC